VLRVFVALLLLSFPKLASAIDPYAIPTTGQEQQQFVPAKLVPYALGHASRYSGNEYSWYLYEYLRSYRDALLTGRFYTAGIGEVYEDASWQGTFDAKNGIGRATPEDFGYTRQKLEGRFRIEREGTVFYSNNGLPHPELWFRLGKNFSLDQISEGPIYVVEVWLSPQKEYGYGQGYLKQEIVLLSACVKGPDCI
jgi:hypothetical protein